MVADCAFCRIAAGEIPAPLLHSDDRAVAFRDLNPQAPTHVLVIPREHIASVAVAEPGHEPLLGHLITVAAEIARREGLQEGGYRLVLNHGPDAGQSVLHIHLHLLGGRQFGWPPG
jgi:histidine triad (HIT) family protein